MNDIDRPIVPIEARVAGDITIAGLAPKPLERLRRVLSFMNPEVVNAKRRGHPASGLPDMIEALVEEPDGSVHLPRGCKAEIRRCLAEDFLRPVYVDGCSDGEPIDLPTLGLAGPSPRYYQVDGAYELERSGQGLVVIPCGGGKTTLGVVAITRVARKTLVIVHTEDLLDQWVETIRSRLTIEPGYMKNDEGVLSAPVVVAMVGTLIRFLETPEGLAWVRRFGLLIVDEAHHAPCETFQTAITKIPARYRLGLTATPDREDGMGPLMDWTFGERLLEVSTETLFEKGYLTRPRLQLVETAFRFDHAPRPEQPTARWEAIRMAKLQKKLVADPDRNALIAELAAREVLAGESVLVLSNHKAHCRTLGRLIWERGAPAIVLVGQSGKAAKESRKATIQAMRDGEVRCVIATSLADEGLDVVRLSRIILALPASSKRMTTQRTGRLMRNFEGKKPILYDVIDPHVETLCNRADERRKVYKKLGLD